MCKIHDSNVFLSQSDDLDFKTEESKPVPSTSWHSGNMMKLSRNILQCWNVTRPINVYWSVLKANPCSLKNVITESLCVCWYSNICPETNLIQHVKQWLQASLGLYPILNKQLAVRISTKNFPPKKSQQPDPNPNILNRPC